MTNPQIFSSLFFILLILKLIFQIYLNRRNYQFVKKHRPSVPELFSKQVDVASHQKAADYTCEKLNFAIVSTVISNVVLLAWLPLGGLERLDQMVRTFGFTSELSHGMAIFAAFLIIGFILDLPETLYSTFVLEEKYGFNRTTPKTFVVDLIKQTVLGVVIGAPILLGILYFYISMGSVWWLVAWGFLTLVQLLLLWAYPNFLAPIFNKFTPLEDGELKNKIETLAKKTEFFAEGIFVMDASKRSGHGNAYFTGFGKYKRIVFFDTLLKQLNPDELEAVLAHEIGHFKHKHILKGLLISLTFSFLGFALLGKLASTESFYLGHFVTTPSPAMALLLFMMVIPLYTFFLTPLMNTFSRKNEYEADSYAATHSNAFQLIEALLKLYKENASSLTTDKIYSRFYYSHPLALERVEYLQVLGKKS
ncbi:MAG: M48 family metallopeptidase [Bacteriovoracaceae bacterium]|nr:M48 family metallopeptidase [Bacteriovoracaceae bacterium]